MRPEFLRAVVDTLLPGMAAAAGRVPVPSGTEAGIDLARYGETARPALDAIAAAAGDTASFARATEEERATILRKVERDHAESFRVFVTALVVEYYETPAVLTAFGWRASPPQPEGHAVPEADAETERRLDRVRQRAPLWRR